MAGRICRCACMRFGSLVSSEVGGGVFILVLNGVFGISATPAVHYTVTQSELSIHEGLTSVGPQVGVLQSNELNYRSVDAAATSKEYVVPAATGFYVRFQGVFSAAAKLSLVYTVFGYGEATKSGGGVDYR